MRLGDIDKLKEKVFSFRQQTFDRNFLEHVMSKKECPTITIQDIWPRAKWVSTGAHTGPNYNKIYRCSNCDFQYAFRTKYCPDCGFKMDSDEYGKWFSSSKSSNYMCSNCKQYNPEKSDVCPNCQIKMIDPKED